MSYINWKTRQLWTGERYTEEKVPYCANCGKIIEDIAHAYCGWCGASLSTSKPLTPDQLKAMCGEPVYIVQGDVSWWEIIRYICGDYLFLGVNDCTLSLSEYGSKWEAYAREPNREV